ncbi:amino acid ABC transporter substrate-binding protein [Alloscardovia theropitheci]|uniref:Amino acid ABC transporter substrate-binding protein n=1 Tax=Alloscardovia theropitheci TaxID=2496842 RepID=A0A4R0QRE3_9BIFI|nr:ABC transporter substrate-binding protein [Alloscardovia theropitheci]TCD54932.1 amino acid ABC transporter substrate-binding protein [Alloscardovia theropitheci]
MINKKNFGRTILAGATAALLAFTAACGSTNSNSNSETVTEGKLTIATGEPAYSPWVLNNKPQSGEGYEAAVAYAVAKEMGYDAKDVKWTRSTFDSAIAPGAKDWDMNIQQFSITEQRKQAVDFSPSYYNSTQALVVKSDNKFANATTLAELKDAVIGAMSGTTSYQQASEKIKNDITLFNNNDDAVAALASGQIDVLVVDAPTSVNMVESGQAGSNGKVLGQIANSEDKEGTGIVLPKGSKLTEKVTKAVNTLKQNGTLKELQDKWLSSYTNLPVLK